MPTSSSSAKPKLIDIQLLKLLVIVNALVPGVLLVWDAYHGQLGVNEVNFAIRTTGLIGLVLLVLSLAITPLRRLTGWALLIGPRRNLGVIGFLYILTHFLIFFWWDRAHDVGDTIHEIIERQYLWFGFGALVLMVPLAITSTDGMVSRLGAKRWKLLHRLNYAIVIAGVVHYYLLVKSDTTQPFAFAVVVGALIAYRIGANYVDLRREVRDGQQKLLAAKSAAPKKKKFWKGKLKIARIFDETGDVKTFRLVSPDGGPLPFEHVAGQYLSLALDIGGKKVARSYTIASSPTRHAYCEISVKRASDGYGSKHLHDTWREGALVDVSAPAGKFFFAGHESDRIVLLAGGIGITPMMSVARSLTDRGWSGQIYLVFAVRAREDVVFADEIAYLQKRFPNLHVLVTLTGPDDGKPWDGKRGRISKETLQAFVPGFTHGPVMMCGPDAMMKATRELLVSMGIPDEEVHEEAFVSPVAMPAVADGLASEAMSAPADEPNADGSPANVTFQRAGKSSELTPELSVLEAAEECGVAIPFECRSGICGQCKVKLVSGKVRMDAQDALSPSDRAKGLILACQAHAARDVVVDA